jgi:hypothetical protein
MHMQYILKATIVSCWGGGDTQAKYALALKQICNNNKKYQEIEKPGKAMPYFMTGSPSC